MPKYLLPQRGVRWRCVRVIWCASVRWQTQPSITSCMTCSRMTTLQTTQTQTRPRRKASTFEFSDGYAIMRLLRLILYVQVIGIAMDNPSSRVCGGVPHCVPWHSFLLHPLLLAHIPRPTLRYSILPGNCDKLLCAARYSRDAQRQQRGSHHPSKTQLQPVS